MDRRSTSVKGFVHFGGEVRSGVEDGIGLSLGHASTGSTCWIETISDDTNAHLGIRAQGAGTITLGTSSNAVKAPGGIIAAAGATIKGAYSTTFTWALAALTSGAQGEITLTTSLSTLLMPGDLIGMISLAAPDETDLTIQDIRQSSVGSSILTIVVGNIASTATSTESGTGRITWIDLT